jgi:general secretion pathway protein G
MVSVSNRNGPDHGFTLIELLVVMAIIATLLSLAAPRYAGNVDKAKEAVLRENLVSLRDAIDKYFADNGSYPAALDDLVAKRYLRRIPVDPITDSATSWITAGPPNPQQTGIYDVHSAAKGHARDGTAYRDW